jgi:pilus assembly protein CpaC
MASIHRSLAIALALAATLLWAAAADAVEVLDGQATVLTLEVGNGRLIRLDGPAASVLVADPDVADVASVSPAVIWVYAILPGETNVFAVDANDAVVANVRLIVRQSVAQASRAMREVSPRGAVRVSPVGEDTLMLTGTVSSPSEAADVARVAGAFVPEENVINRTMVEGPTQINLRVRIAEVQRNALRDIGIQWDVLFEAGDFAGRFATGFGAAAGATDLALNYFDSGTVNLNVTLDALEQAGLAMVLAEPNLSAISGETASFLAGGEFPYPVAQEEGEISVEFKEFGVSLAFTPTVLDSGRISMRVRPEVSSLSFANAVEIQGTVVPALTTRRAETTIELGSGQSFAIAGLFQSEVDDTTDIVPLLGDLPILGPLFRSERFERRESELVIVVTPYLVEPVSNPGDVITPGTQLSRPTDPTVDDFVLNRDPAAAALGTPGAAATLAGGRRASGAGFILN